MVNPGSLAQGFTDVMKDKTLFTPEQADMIVRTQMQKMSIKKILPNIEACNNFLAENAKKAGVSQRIKVMQGDIRNFELNDQITLLMCNPPYGERLLDV